MSVKNAEYVRRFESSDWPLLRQIIHGDNEIGGALTGSEISTGSARCAPAATLLSRAATADRSGAGGSFSGKFSTEEQPANRTQSNTVRNTRTPTRCGKLQAAAVRSNQTRLRAAAPGVVGPAVHAWCDQRRIGCPGTCRQRLRGQCLYILRPSTSKFSMAVLAISFFICESNGMGNKTGRVAIGKVFSARGLAKVSRSTPRLQRGP